MLFFEIFLHFFHIIFPVLTISCGQQLHYYPMAPTTERIPPSMDELPSLTLSRLGRSIIINIFRRGLNGPSFFTDCVFLAKRTHCSARKYIVYKLRKPLIKLSRFSMDFIFSDSFVISNIKKDKIILKHFTL